MNIKSKENGWKKSSFCETDASLSFIPMKKMSLWGPIMKEKEIIMCIHVIPIDVQTLILRKMVDESFSYKTKSGIHLSQ